jgi:hypothetical protein
MNYQIFRVNKFFKTPIFFFLTLPPICIVGLATCYGGPLPSASVHRGALFSGVALFRVFARELMSNDCEKENKRKWLIYGFVFSRSFNELAFKR